MEFLDYVIVGGVILFLLPLFIWLFFCSLFGIIDEDSLLADLLIYPYPILFGFFGVLLIINRWRAEDILTQLGFGIGGIICLGIFIGFTRHLFLRIKNHFENR